VCGEALGVVGEKIGLQCEVETTSRHSYAGDGAAPIQVELYGKTGLLGPDRRTAVALAAGEKGRLQRERYFLRGFVDGLMLSAAGLLDGGETLVLACNHGKRVSGRHADRYVRRVRAFDREEALGYLQTLVREMYGRSHDYVLPVEVALDSGLHGRGTPEALIEEYVRGGWGNRTASAYGPIDNPSSFGAPDDAAAIIERRFGPYFERITGVS